MKHELGNTRTVLPYVFIIKMLDLFGGTYLYSRINTRLRFQNKEVL